MVRSDGRRAPELDSVHLLALAPASTDALGPPPRRLTDQFELPGYFEDGTSGVVSLKRVSRVPVEALDYCVFSDEGMSQLDTAGVAPDGLWPSWAARYEVLKERAIASIAAVDASPDEQKPNVRRAMFRSARDGLVTPQVNGAIAKFNLKRVARVNEPYGRALLTKYAQFLARDAFDRPLLLD